jgi:glycine/D-amino acid oxidase-like deaminating enzyme
MRRFSTTFIIGTGVFGLSLLDHITKARPSDKAVAFDSGEKESAVNDTHKITRPLYPSKRRTEIATENHEAWKAVREHYAPIGRLEITDDISKLDAIDVHLSKPRERHTKESIAKLLESPAILPRMRLVWEFAWNILNTANDPSLCCIWNEDDGVINWNPCIEEIRRPLQSMIRDKGVTRLIVGDEGWIRGLQLESGETIEISKEDQVVLTAGAWTAQLLKKSNIAAPPKGFRTVGVFTFPLKLNELHWEYIKDLPALSFQTREINCRLPPCISIRY